MGLTKKEAKILEKISKDVRRNLEKPDFPFGNSKFPATPLRKIKIFGFTNLWVKDESVNPCGTHKDRMAWEVIRLYRDILENKKRGNVKKIPQISIISSGSAALSIQSYIKKYGLPSIKVLIDKNTSVKIEENLKEIGCIIYKTDLSKKMLNWKEILKITKNKNGLEMTSMTSYWAIDQGTLFYDSLAYEILNVSPNYCFIPFGTGNLYENILSISKRELSTDNHDPRFKGKIENLRKCVFLGSTTLNPNSKAEKLYAPHLPFSEYNQNILNSYIFGGYCGIGSKTVPIEEKFLEKAMKIAKQNKISCEYSGIAGLALFLKLKNKIPKDKRILIVNTGNARKLEN